MAKSIDFMARQSGTNEYNLLFLRSLCKMAQFPKAEADVVALANAMVAGYGARAADFPSADAAIQADVREKCTSEANGC